MKKHTQKIKLLKVRLGHSSSIEHDGVGKAIEKKLSGLWRPAPCSAGFPAKCSLCQLLQVCESVLGQFNNPSQKQWWRCCALHLGEALGCMQALSSPDPDREAKGTLCNAPTFPAMTRMSELLISETSGGKERSRNALKRQQSLLRSDMVMEGTQWHSSSLPACLLLSLPSLSGMRVCDSGDLACLLAALWVGGGAPIPKDSCLSP